MYEFMQAAHAGEEFDDGAFIDFLRVLMANPEVLIWERFWLERNKDLDRELYGMVKWCKPDLLDFGLNVWNRNHFNIFRRAQWPWAEQTMYADWVKPITYQHQSGEIWHKEFGFFQKSILRDFDPIEGDAVLDEDAGAEGRTAGQGDPGRAWTPTPMSTGNAPTRCAAFTARPRSTWASASTRRGCARIRRSARPISPTASVMATYREGGARRGSVAQLLDR